VWAAATIRATPDAAAGAAEADFLARLIALAPTFGVTRLADITRLDTIGLPVWQAIRPAGRALSVHQGKGATDTAARIGALCEAMESDCGERVEADGPCAAFEALPEAERAPAFADYAARREAPAPEGPVDWCIAEEILSGGAFHLPFDLVSVDFTRREPSWFERSSTGLGAGPNSARSRRTALCELVERDAVGEWERSGPLDRLASEVDAEAIGLDWFEAWRARLRAAGLALRVFAPDAVIGLPVFVCWIAGEERFASRHRRYLGSGADGYPEAALFKALAEAIQSRLTFIAAVRDDMLPSLYARPSPPLGDVPPAPPGFALRDWRECEPHGATWEEVAGSLAAAGFRRIAMKEIQGDLLGVAVTRAFVPGLGSLTRTRRGGCPSPLGRRDI
jgi:ribosomal protein S12 methylthiotransferase accessory factor